MSMSPSAATCNLEEMEEILTIRLAKSPFVRTSHPKGIRSHMNYHNHNVHIVDDFILSIRTCSGFSCLLIAFCYSQNSVVLL